MNEHTAMKRNILNFVGFQIGWLSCVLGAGNGWSWLGPVVVAGLLALHLRLDSAPTRTLGFVGTVALIGFALDSLQGLAGVFSFPSLLTPPWLCPPWLATLWLIFATTLPNSLSWLSRRYALAAVLGLVAGPLSYYAGHALGALRLSNDIAWSLLTLAILWCLLMPALMHLMEIMVRRQANSTVTLVPESQ